MRGFFIASFFYFSILCYIFVALCIIQTTVNNGIFVFPVVDHAALYCVALAVGSALGAVILSLVKKTQPAEAK